MGREVDKSVCDGADCLHVSHHWSSMVARAAFPDRLVKPQHTVYRVRRGNPAIRRIMAALGSEDSERLQDLPAGGQADYAVGDAVQYRDCKRDVNK